MKCSHGAAARSIPTRADLPALEAAIDRPRPPLDPASARLGKDESLIQRRDRTLTIRLRNDRDLLSAAAQRRRRSGP